MYVFIGYENNRKSPPPPPPKTGTASRALPREMVSIKGDKKLSIV